MLRKVRLHADDRRAHPDAGYHTVVVDHRHVYESGAHADKYSGHDLYYKRGSGAYSLSQMHKVGSIAELKRLVRMKDHELPEKARGSLPAETPELVARAEKAHASRLRKDRTLKSRKRAEKAAA